MSSLPKISFTRKTGTVIVGITLFGSLALSACAPAAQTNDSAPNPTAVTTTEAPKGVQKFQSEAFDLSKQVSLDVKNDKSSILLGTGVITQGKDGDKTTVTFTPYESENGEWKYTTDVALQENQNIYVKLLRWKDKSYVVVKGVSESSSEASGLTAATKTQTEHVIVLDAVTGKVANTIKGEPSEVGASSGNFFLDTDSALDIGGGVEVAFPFMTSLTYKSDDGTKLVDPLTGQTLTARDSTSAIFNDESGFYEARDFYAVVGGEYEKTTIKGVFGNYALVATQQPEIRSKTGSYMQNSKYSLVNTVTKAVVSEMTCVNATHNIATTYSPDFRYVTFLGNFVFDTQTGKSFCTIPADNPDVRQFTVTSVDNSGNMYGTVDSGEYMRINLADTTKVETLAKVNAGKELPIRITDKGSAVFYSDNSDEVLVVVPAK